MALLSLEGIIVAQSKRQSLKETMTNTGVGMVGSWLITMGTFSALGVSNVAGNALASTVATIGCTVWSIARGYTIRRMFNKLNEKEKQNDTTIQTER
ncbi:hypothetical protein VCM_00055 [Pseudomonas phage VCM]|uniref:Uncharacterized protein n=1 Tax=Pseudomonas phage VCM TaxID=1729937 RepID=A0A0S4L1H1_9CAUD|nr:hypothetical protein VCM_00055 [Pseudomonas phage VCM]CUR44274.1 hypothetical protein VCM_00055 [Pseudomonas phage VCM]